MIRRSIRDFLVYGFTTFGVFWTVAESYGAFFENQKPEGLFWYLAIVVVSSIVGIVGIWKGWPRSCIEVPIPASDSCVEIKFGDLFVDTDVVVIPVNEFFDGSLGDHVSEKSLHGYFIKNYLGGQSSTFNEMTSKALDAIPSESIKRPNGRKSKYPIGTVAAIDINEQRFLLAAFTKTDLSTLKASATVHELWDCLAGIWVATRDRSNGRRVSLPLIGSGLSGVGLPARNLVEIIITSFLFYTKQQKIADRVTLVLPSRLRSELDLTSIKRSWK